MAAEIISRRDARSQGLKRYFTGEPCKRGHIAERQVSNLTCLECTRIKSQKRYAEGDREKARAVRRRWDSANRDKRRASSRKRSARPEVKAAQAAWYQANKDRIRSARLARYAEQREQRIAYSKAWVEANREKSREHFRMAASRRRARKRGSPGTHTAADLADILKAQGNRCAYCCADLRRAKKHVDHIVPLARSGSNGRSNLQYLCQPCNQAKNWKDPLDYAQSIGLLL